MSRTLGRVPGWLAGTRMPGHGLRPGGGAEEIRPAHVVAVRLVGDRALILIRNKTGEEIFILKRMGMLHMVKHASVKQHVSDMDCVVTSACNAFIYQCSDRLATDKTFRVGSGRKTILAVLDVENRSQV